MKCAQKIPFVASVLFVYVNLLCVVFVGCSNIIADGKL